MFRVDNEGRSIIRLGWCDRNRGDGFRSLGRRCDVFMGTITNESD